MAAKSREVAPLSHHAAHKSRSLGWRLVTDFAAIGVAGYAVYALFNAARDERLQRDAALSEQRNLRLEVRDLKDKLAAFSASLAAGETP